MGFHPRICEAMSRTSAIRQVRPLQIRERAQGCLSVGGCWRTVEVDSKLASAMGRVLFSFPRSELARLASGRLDWQKRSFSEAQDTGVLLRALDEIWREVPDRTLLRVGVALSGLAPEQAHQLDLFDKPNDARLVTAIDRLNAKFGKGAIAHGAAGADQTMLG